MLVKMKRDWAYDLIPGSTRRTLPSGLEFDVAPEVAMQAIAEGAAEAVVVTFAAAPESPDGSDLTGEGTGGGEGADQGTGGDAGAGEGEGDGGADQAPALAPPPAPAARTKKSAAAPAPAPAAAVPAPAEPVEPA